MKCGLKMNYKVESEKRDIFDLLKIPFVLKHKLGFLALHIYFICGPLIKGLILGPRDSESCRFAGLFSHLPQFVATHPRCTDAYSHYSRAGHG